MLSTTRDDAAERLDRSYHPDMVEEVRVMAESEEGPILFIVRRKAPRSLLSRLFGMLPPTSNGD
jgi:hypothetical protein